ncbi:MAG: acyl-CoA/acyl-ACP dehydrogenase, partial [Acidimicrobiia bacterium]|nr:acyl-CoA/acyl-ACP dehydrogenase [Acidimicrobiia bacterium]
FDLASQILTDKLDIERLREIEATDDWFDRDAYAELARTGLVGIALTEAVGGGGQDLVAWSQVLRAQGASVAPMPLLPTMLGSLAIDQLGSDEQRRRLLPGVVDGSRVLAVADQEPNDEDVRAPGARVADGALTGTKIVVEFGAVADQLVVSALDDSGQPRLWLVEADARGISRTRSTSTRLEPLFQLDFDATPAEPLGGDGAVDWLVDRHLLALCSTQVGVSETALKMTAEYTSQREQFGRPVATFQAVTQRLADQYINVNGIRLTTAAAIWRLANGVDAADAILVAKWWASERAQDVVHATQHCHGGMGVSVDYPLFRYTLWSKHLTVSLGGGTRQLRALGARLAG